MIPSVVLTALKEIAKYLGKKLDSVENAVEALGKKLDPTEHAKLHARGMIALSEQIDGLVSKLKDPKVEVSVDLDTTDLEHLLADAKKNFQAPDLSTIEVLLKRIYECTDEYGEEQSKMLSAGFSKLIAAILKKKVEFPDTIKLDRMQVAELAKTSGGMSAGGTPAATKVTTTNIDMALKANEYSYRFPTNTVAWKIKLRDQGTLFYYAFEEGLLPNSGSATDYITAPQNFIVSQPGIEWSGKTIYLGAEANTQVAEIESYQL